MRNLLLFLTALSLTACPRAADRTPSGADRKAEIQRLRRELKSLTKLRQEVATLDRRLDGGDTKAPWKIVNFHEHVYKMAHAEKYYAAATASGIRQTVLVTSPKFTIFGKGASKTDGIEENWQIVRAIAQRWPDHFIPFTTLTPGDPNKLVQLRRHRAEGAQGLKLYNGHSNYFVESEGLMPAGMDEVLQFCADNKMPVLWHIRLSRFGEEFEEKVLKKHPDLKLVIAHYGVAFWRPEGKIMAEVDRLLDTYKNLYFDTSLGTRKILVDGMALMGRHKDKFVRMIQRHPDRFVIGTDMVITGNPEKTVSWMSKCIWAVRDQMERGRFRFALGARWSKYHPKKGADNDGWMTGLELPKETLDLIYQATPARLLEGSKLP